MKRSSLLLLAVFLLVGCGDSSTPAVVTGEDELQKWVAENPVPETSDASTIDGAVK